jgi:hypothetical protein
MGQREWVAKLHRQSSRQQLPDNRGMKPATFVKTFKVKDPKQFRSPVEPPTTAGQPRNEASNGRQDLQSEGPKAIPPCRS